MYIYRLKPKTIKVIMRITGITKEDIVNVLEVKPTLGKTIVSGKTYLSQNSFMKIKEYINSFIAGKPFSTVELARLTK